MAAQYWLMKNEPASYSIDDFAREKRTEWEGVRNYQARNFMRDDMQVGDKAIFYHSNANPSAAVGWMEICSKPYPDHTQFDTKSKYYDSKATKEKPRWFMVDVCFKKKFANPIPLADIKADPELKNMMVAQKGSRLSIQPVEEKHFKRLLELGNRK